MAGGTSLCEYFAGNTDTHTHAQNLVADYESVNNPALMESFSIFSPLVTIYWLMKRWKFEFK